MKELLSTKEFAVKQVNSKCHRTDQSNAHIILCHFLINLELLTTL